MHIQDIQSQIAVFFTPSIQAANKLYSNVENLFARNIAKRPFSSLDFSFFGRQLCAFTSVAVKFFPLLLLKQVTAGDCGTVLNPQSLYFQKNNTSFRTDLSAGFSLEDIQNVAASCEFTLSNATIPGAFQKVASCVCYAMIHGSTDDLPFQSSTLDLYQQNATDTDIHCMLSACSGSCGQERISNSSIVWATFLAISFLGICCFVGYKYKCRSSSSGESDFRVYRPSSSETFDPNAYR